MTADFAAEVAANRVVVIEAAGSVRGYMIAWPEPDAYFIDNIAIDPQSQGDGLGRRLIDHAVAQAEKLKLPALRLYTNVLMTENLSMYAHIGFVETHRVVEKGFHRVAGAFAANSEFRMTAAIAAISNDHALGTRDLKKGAGH